jgi:putative phage-type endonuclease
MNLEDDISTCLILFYDYVEENPTSVILPDFEQTMINNIEELIHNDKEEEYIEDVIDVSLEIFYETIYPSRSFPGTFCQIQSNKEKEIITYKLNKINNIEQPQQKTNEWYTTRQGLLTASNAYKMFDSPCQQNSLIYEKCKPKTIEDMNPKNINIDSSLHWGNKYEPLSVLLYEYNYKTKIGEYGFLPHDKYKFLGASPDGINIDPLSDRYGRMLEIKNIVNRDITGIPKKEYWVQMQLQMEVFNLNECDFLETRFIEYENEIEFLRDSDDSIFISKNQEKKGIILYFSDNNTGNPFYIYTPLNITYLEYELWSEKIIQETLDSNPSFVWIRQIYWKLDEISCVLVKRNKHWFQNAVPIMTDFWNTIQNEKINGYDHRAPKTKNKIN